MGNVNDNNRETMKPIIKRMIMNKGGVQISYYAGNGANSATGDPAYFRNNGTSTDHSVMAVGWDDNYSRENFGTTEDKRPKANGAWLVRNSWGTYSGSDKGYFWMSYEQYLAGVTVYSVKECEEDTTCYYHDALGHTSSTSYAYAANVFKIEEDNEGIKEVGFFTTDNNATYDLYIFDLGENEPSGPMPSNKDDYRYKSENNTVTYAGYHTKTLPEIIPISKGHYFSVITKMTTPNYGWPTAIEMKAGTYANPDVNAGESYFAYYRHYYQENGVKVLPPANTDQYEYWIDGSAITSKLEDNSTVSTPYNACIKAFTVKIADKGIALSSVNFPDANFLAELKQFDTDNDGYLSTVEIAAVTEINVSGKEILTLAGIEYFTALQTLDCSNNSLSELDLSSNTALTSVDCSNNQLTYLILGKNSNLDSLNCSNNNLGSVDISGCPKLYNNSNYQHDDFDEGVPELKFNSVLLSGEIGLRFYMTLPKISDVDYSSSSMAFYIKDKPVGETQNYSSSEKKVSGDQTYYIFTCYVNSAQMAEDITAHFAYGAGKSVEFVKSIHTYLESAVSNAVSLNLSEKTIALMNAIRDYGHYAQLMLSEVRGWKIPDDYAEMPGTGTTYSAEDISAVNTDVTANYALTLTSQQAAGIKSMNYSLTFDTDTAINLYLTLTDDFKAGLKSTTKTLTVKVDDAEKNAEEQQDGEYKGSYLVKISGIYAHKLGTPHTIEITADGTTAMQIYALSYAKTILNMGTATDAMKNAVTALYNYYKATVEYKAEKEGGNQ